MRIISIRKRKLIRSELCSDCGRPVNQKYKGMNCMKCGKLICYKCNLGYKCKSCYSDNRLDYYTDSPIGGNSIEI